MTTRRRTVGPKKKKQPPSFIMLVMEDGPHRCLTPIPRNDLSPNTPGFTLPYLWGTVSYRLVGVDEDRVHHYRWEPNHE